MAEKLSKAPGKVASPTQRRYRPAQNTLKISPKGRCHCSLRLRGSETTSPQYFTPERALGSIMKGLTCLVFFFFKAILEQSRKQGAIPPCPGAVALLAEAAFSLCDTRLSPALGVSVGRRHPGAQRHHLQPSPAPAGTRAPSPGFPKAPKVGNHASDIPTERAEDEE